MSRDATAWAWSVDPGNSSMKLVLLSMADRADEQHQCYPSIERLEKDTRLNRKTIIASIGKMEQMGLIKDTGQRKGRTQKVKVYCLNLNEKTVPKAEQYQKRNDSTFSSKQSQFYQINSPKNGTQNQSLESVREPESASTHANAAPDELQTQNPSPVIQSDLTTPSSESAAPTAAPTTAHQTTLDDNGHPVTNHPLADDWQPDVDTLTAGLRRSGIPLDVCQCLADDLELRANFVNNALANPGRSHTTSSWNMKLAIWLQRDWQKLKRPMTPVAYRLERGLDTDTAAHAQLAAECPLDQIHALWCQHLGNIKPPAPLDDWKRTNAAKALATRWAEGFTAPLQSDPDQMRYTDQEDSLGWWDWLFSVISKTEKLRNDDWVSLIRLGNPDIFAMVLAELARPTGSQ